MEGYLAGSWCLGGDPNGAVLFRPAVTNPQRSKKGGDNRDAEILSSGTTGTFKIPIDRVSSLLPSLQWEKGK